LKKTIFFVFSNRNFLKMQFSNDSFSLIWFKKIVLFIYEIEISNAPVFCNTFTDIRFYFPLK